MQFFYLSAPRPRTFLLLGLVIGTLWFPLPAFAATEAQYPLPLTVMIITLVGGLSFFLYGMEKMSTGLKQSAGDQMRAILAALTRNTFIGLLAGAFVTMVIQSSSATMVMLISFVQSQLMSFTQSLGVILGANIGTTITAQLVAFKLTDLALVMVSVGFLLHMFGKNQRTKSIGEILLGFGILFYGMKLMSDAMKPLRSSLEFVELMKGLETPLLGLVVGMIFTALVQSSSATMGVIIVIAQQDLLSLEAGIPLILGANVGTCVTALLAAIGTGRDAQRVALAYVLIEFIGVVLFLFWIEEFAQTVRLLTGDSGAGTARQIANAHTVFNVTLGILFLPLVGVVARLCTLLLPDKKTETGVIPATWHLDDSMLATPALAIELVRAEISRMAKILYRMHRAAIYPFVSNKPRHDAIYPHLTLLEGIEMRERKIDYLEKKTRNYILKINRNELTPAQAAETMSLVSLLDSMEGIGDTITKLLVPLIAKKQRLKTDFSNQGKRELIIYHRKVGHQLQRLQDVMTTLASSVARTVVQKKNRYAELDSEYRKAHLARLFADQRDSQETHTIHIELMDAIKIINMHTAEIADILLTSGILGDEERGHMPEEGTDARQMELEMTQTNGAEDEKK